VSLNRKLALFKAFLSDSGLVDARDTMPIEPLEISVHCDRANGREDSSINAIRLGGTSDFHFQLIFIIVNTIIELI
jgi:hypothetical protein